MAEEEAMKKTNALIGSALLLFVSANLTQAVSLTVDAVSGLPIDASVTLSQGDAFNLNVYVNDVLDLAGFQFELSFDPAVLAATTITSGDLFGVDTFLIDDTILAGLVSFSEISLGLTGLDLSTQTLLGTISFDAIAVGATTLTLGNALLTNSFAAEITPVDLIGATATVTANSTVPIPPSALLLSAGLAVLTLVRFK